MEKLLLFVSFESCNPNIDLVAPVVTHGNCKCGLILQLLCQFTVQPNKHVVLIKKLVNLN